MARGFLPGFSSVRRPEPIALSHLRPGQNRIGYALVLLSLLWVSSGWSEGKDMLIDDFASADLISKLGTSWRTVSDRVMGGVSAGSIEHDVIEGRPCLRLAGTVRLENNGGFIQAALDLAPASGILDANDYAGIRLVVRGNDESYSIHLRTRDNVRPWQSYRAQILATSDWQTIDIPFEDFEPYRLETPMDIRQLRRMGLVAIGRAFQADVAISHLSLYR